MTGTGWKSDCSVPLEIPEEKKQVFTKVVEQILASANTAIEQAQANMKKIDIFQQLVETQTVLKSADIISAPKPQQVRDIYTSVLNARSKVEQFRRAYERLHQERVLLEQRSYPPAERLYKELIGLYSEFPDLRIDLEGKTISVDTEQIVLPYKPLNEEPVAVNLGKYRITYTYTGSSAPLKNFLVDSLTSSIIPYGYVHPYVDKEHHICAHTKLVAAAQDYRLSEVFRIIIGTLSSPDRALTGRMPLSNWVYVYCSQCGNRITRAIQTRAIGCRYCDNIVCEQCQDRANLCSICGKISCHKHTGKRAVAHHMCGYCKARAERAQVISTAGENS